MNFKHISADVTLPPATNSSGLLSVFMEIYSGIDRQSLSHLFTFFERKDQSFNPNHKVVREDW